MTANKDEIARRIGRNVTNLLIENGITQLDLANALGVHKSTVSAWCNGTRTPRMPMVDKMCEYFRTSRSKILGDTTSPRELFGETEYLKVPADGPANWYDDPTVRTVTDKLKDNDNYRVLFEAVSKVKPEDIDFVTSFIKRMGGDL